MNILTEDNIFQGNKICDSDGRFWKVLCKHPDWQEQSGWVIRSKECNRLIFPIDMDEYWIS
jgi:hypothetical protein